MTESDEKLYKEIENCLEYDDDIYEVNSVFLDTTSIENLMNWFKNKETDLLKEFVAWYRKCLIKDHDDKVKQHEKAIMSKSLTDEAYCRGRVDEVRSLIDLLDIDLEKFMEDIK